MKYAIHEAKSWARANLRGYVAVVFTPYDARGHVDEAALRKDVDYTLALPGVGGLYVGSIYQEFWTLTEAERKVVAEIVLDQVAGRASVIVSASHTAIESAIDLADHARRHGADLVMLWPPYFGPRGDDAMVEYYRSVMREVPIGFAFYNSGLAEVGFQMSPDTLRALADEPQMCALKEASLRLDTYLQTLDAIGADVLVSSPLEEFWLVGRMLFPQAAPDMLLGSSRVLFLQTPERPHLHQFYLDALAGRWEECRTRLTWLLGVGEHIHTAALRGGSHPVGLIKSIRAHLGQSGGRPRPPIPAPGREEVDAAVAALRAAGV